ncbi:MAG TPA: helix-turn-helix transcriptional regulator, partial [Chloroflexota bacterium]|nr:helix-turn-helix transcriptional regulator [Chloroflexota bacterium]
VLQLVARGHSDAEIAGILVLHPRTVKKHLEHIYRKLDVTSRTAAIARAFLTQ